MQEDKKITVIGAGNIGSTLVEKILCKDLVDIIWMNRSINKAKAKAIDLMQSSYFEKFSKTITATDDFSLTANSQIIVITAGEACKQGMNREDLLERNSKVLEYYLSPLLEQSPQAIFVICTNPVDAICDHAYKILKPLGIDAKQIIGMGSSLDAARFAYFISKKLNCKITDIIPVVTGPHNKSMQANVQKTLVKGISLEKILNANEINELIEATKNSGDEIVSLLETGSAYFSPASALVEIIDSIINDRNKEICCSVYDEEAKVFTGKKVIIGANSIIRV